MKSTLLIKITLFISLLTGFMLPAIAEDGLEAIKTHMEFLGYATEASEKAVLGTHTTRLNLRIIPQSSGYIGLVLYDIKDDITDDNNELLTMTNNMNKKATLFRAYVNNRMLFLEGWYAGPYERTRFGEFLEQINDDVTGRIKEYQEEMTQFLK